MSRACVSPYVSRTICVIFSIKYTASVNGVTLKSVLGVSQGHWK